MSDSIIFSKKMSQSVACIISMQFNVQLYYGCFSSLKMQCLQAATTRQDRQTEKKSDVSKTLKTFIARFFEGELRETLARKRSKFSLFPGAQAVVCLLCE